MEKMALTSLLRQLAEITFSMVCKLLIIRVRKTILQNLQKKKNPLISKIQNKKKRHAHSVDHPVKSYFFRRLQTELSASLKYAETSSMSMYIGRASVKRGHKVP